ncbi:MAG: DUF3786 domain-containing protein [Deltaproteobacteria bacterium]|nr:DUF3786 domain-containing protein [Deltaproteobacteria bacterium]
MENQKIFDQKLNHDFSRVKKIDFLKNAEILGIRQKNGSLIFDFFNRQIIFSQDGIDDAKGIPLTDAVKDVLCQYLLMCPDPMYENSDKLVTLREFSESGPLFSRFTANTGKIIETTFSGNLEKLISRCLALDGTILKNTSYDLSVRFKALSRIPIVLNYNDIEDMMPASAGFLFQDNADKYLDLKSLSILCTYLTGQLIQEIPG